MMNFTMKFLVLGVQILAFNNEISPGFRFLLT